MKKLTRSFYGIIAALAIVTVVVLSQSSVVKAKTTTQKMTNTTYFTKDGDYTWHLSCGDALKKSAVSAIKVTGDPKCCTKPKIEINKYGNLKEMEVMIRLKKAGKVKISYSVKQNNGDTIKYIYNFTFKNYSNPTTSVKVGKKEYSPEFNDTTFIYAKAKDINGKKIKVKTKKGYTCVGFYVYDGSTSKSYKNGAKISGMKSGGHINIQIEDKNHCYNSVSIEIE